MAKKSSSWLVFVVSLILLYSVVSANAHNSEVALQRREQNVLTGDQDPLLNSKTLYSIRADISYGSGSRSDNVPDIYHLLTTCPDIRHLDLTMQWGGCTISMDDHYAFDFNKGDRFPPLEELRLRGYDFDGSPHPQSYDHRRDPWRQILRELAWEINDMLDDYDLTDFRLPYVPPSPLPQDNRTNLEAWREAMDWSNLRRLDIDSASSRTFTNLKGALPNLRSFRAGPLNLYGQNETERQAVRDALRDFILDAPPLEELGIGAMEKPLPVGQFLEVHGKSLRALEMHEQASYRTEPRPVLNDTQLVRLREECPRLEKLELDVNRNGTWPNSTLSTLATFPQLKHLSLWLELGDGRGYNQPRLTKNLSMALFEDLRAMKAGVELETAIFYLGDWGMNRGGGYHIIDWEEQREAMASCRIMTSMAGDKGVSCDWYGINPDGRLIVGDLEIVDADLEDEEWKVVQAETRF